MSGAVGQANAMSMNVPSVTPIKTIQWAGHTWEVTDYTDQVFTNNNVWVDTGGRLHMKLIYDGQWHDFNLIQHDTAHYGTYRYTIVTDVDYIQDQQNGGNPYFVFSPFLFDNSNPQNNGELDIEMCKWGVDNSNTDWTIHPANHLVQGNHFVGAGNTHTLEWMPDHIKFMVEGPSQPYQEYVYTDRSCIPPDTGYMKNILHIGQFNDAAPPGNMAYYEAEVVLSEYSYTPYTGAQSQMAVPIPEQAPAASSTAKSQSSFMNMAMPKAITSSWPMSSDLWSVYTQNKDDRTSQTSATNSLWSGLSRPFNVSFKWPLSS